MEKKLCGVDLHLHTTRSDGTRTPEEVILDAKSAGLRSIALTDHNQFARLLPTEYEGLEVIPGAEFSSTYRLENGRAVEVHVIGLFFAGVPKELRGVFRKIPRQRKNYLDAIITRLNNLGIALSYEELTDYYPESNQIGRRHIAELLVKKNYAESITDAFDRLIGNRSPYWVDVMKYMNYMPLKKCVELICRNGGIPILAHPYHYHCTQEEVLKLVEDFAGFAAEYPAGMEVHYSKYRREQRAELQKIAEAHGLLPSAASDRHSEKESFEFGEEALLEQMKAAVSKVQKVKD